MNENPAIIRKSSNRLYIYISLSICTMLCLFINFTGNGSLFLQNPVLALAAITIHLTLLTFFIISLIKRPPAIILSEEGIELSDQGFFTWDMLDSVGTISEDDNKEYLVIYFKEFAPIKYNIDNLHKKRKEVIALVLQYAGKQSITYKEHAAA